MVKIKFIRYTSTFDLTSEQHAKYKTKRLYKVQLGIKIVFVGILNEKKKIVFSLNLTHKLNL